MLDFGPIPRGQSAELDFAEKCRKFRGFRVMEMAFAEMLSSIFH